MNVISIPEFCCSVKKSQPTLFLGAGISMASPSKLPAAKGLIHSFVNALISDPQLADLAKSNKLSESSFDKLSSPELIYNAVAEYAKQLVPSIFQAALDCHHPNFNHWIIAQMLHKKYVEQIITTNFDQLIEACIRSKEISLRLEDDDLKKEYDVWKIHGDLLNYMTITMNDVASIGFSALSTLLKKSLFHKKIIIAGYSGNDFHIIRAIMDAQPERIWWIVLKEDIPEAMKILSQKISGIAVVKGDLTVCDDKINPLVALWKAYQIFKIPKRLRQKNGIDSENIIRKRLSDILSHLDTGQKGFILHSLIRRAGLNTTHKYRVTLSSILHTSMYSQNRFLPGVGYTSGKDWIEIYEKLFTPDIAARPIVLKRNGIPPTESDSFGNTTENNASIGKDLSRRDEAEILLNIGLENAFRHNFKRSRTILEVVFKCAMDIGHRTLQMKSAEGLAWIYLWLGEFQNSDEYHTIYLQHFGYLTEKLRVLKDSEDPLLNDELLNDFKPPDEPEKFYSVMSLDCRYRSVVQALRLAGRLRYIGKARFGIEILERVQPDSLPESKYAHALIGFYRFEKGQCLFLTGNVEEGMELIGSAERAFRLMEDWDYEIVRQYYKSVQKYYVKYGRMGDFMRIFLNSKRIF